MKDIKQLTNDQAEHIANIQAKIDIMEHGVIYAALPLISELHDAVEGDKLTIQRLRAGVDKFNSLLKYLDKEQEELDGMYNYYVNQNKKITGEVADNA